MTRPAIPSAALGVELRFVGPVNLGDIATGRVKNVIDCLYPVIGGQRGAPNDARITVLDAMRMHVGGGAGVRIRVAELTG